MLNVIPPLDMSRNVSYSAIGGANEYEIKRQAPWFVVVRACRVYKAFAEMLNMGQNDAGDGSKAARVQEIIDHQVSNESRQHLLADALAPAPSALSDRLWDNTVNGIKKVPDGFVHSLDPRNIMPNLAIGATIGVATKAFLPATGPAGKVAAGALGAWFVGKPLVESYWQAGTATNMLQMDLASTHLGDMVGGLPVAAVEGGIGAKLGSMGTARLLSTKAAEPFVNWRDNQWAKLDTKYDGANATIRTAAFEQLGVGSPLMKLEPGHRAGVIPPYLLETLAKNTKDKVWTDTIHKTESLAANLKPKQPGEGFVQVDYKGAREVFDAKGTESVGTRARVEGEAKTGNADVDNVYDFTGDVRGFYTDVHGRNSIDGKGMKMRSTTNYGQNYENAFWDGEGMFYGKPGTQSPFKTFVLRDITGHEITHGVTEFESKLVYRNQPGALNEHISDVGGALVEQRARGQNANEASWLVGEGIWKDNVNGRALRDMKKPGTAYDDAAIGKDPQPAHMKDYNHTRGDNGGVHYNSGIPNRAFALFAEAMGGKAYETPAKIWYDARKAAGSSPSFAQFAFETVESAKRLGHPDAVAKLEQAWGDVGIKPSKTDTGATDAAPVVLGGVGADNLLQR